MKFNVIYLFLIASISGVIGSDVDPIIINNTNHTDVPTASTVPAADPNTPTTTPVPNNTTTVAPTTKPPPPPTTTAPPNSTTTATTTTTPSNVTTTTVPSNVTTTSTPSTVSTTTESTTVVPTSAPSHKGRKFDGPSFIGGIILASGLMAICFVSWKFYKARTERNYHTL